MELHQCPKVKSNQQKKKLHHLSNLKKSQITIKINNSLILYTKYKKKLVSIIRIKIKRALLIQKYSKVNNKTRSHLKMIKKQKKIKKLIQEMRFAKKMNRDKVNQKIKAMKI